LKKIRPSGRIGKGRKKSMKHKNAVRFLSLLMLVALLAGCASPRKREIYATLSDIDVGEYSAADIMVPSYKTPSQYTDRFPDEYATLAAYGREGVTYILEYVTERKGLDYSNAMFFVCCAYQILGMNVFLDIDMHAPVEHARALQAYLP
jgi:hypothetical protein